MREIYIEFLNELYLSLSLNQNDSWAKSVEKSIDKFNENEDVTSFLRLFGSMGSFGDYYIKDNQKLDNVVSVLKTITYAFATAINKDKKITLSDILLEEINRLNCNIIHNKKIELEYNIDLTNQTDNYNDILNYLNDINDKYIKGNLHEITDNFLIIKNFIKK